LSASQALISEFSGTKSDLEFSPECWSFEASISAGDTFLIPTKGRVVLLAASRVLGLIVRLFSAALQNSEVARTRQKICKYLDPSTAASSD
jgi:hypothetical protein